MSTILDDFKNYVGMYELKFDLDNESGLMQMTGSTLELSVNSNTHIHFTKENANGVIMKHVAQALTHENLISSLKGKLSVHYFPDFWIITFGGYKNKRVVAAQNRDGDGDSRSFEESLISFRDLLLEE